MIKESQLSEISEYAKNKNIAAIVLLSIHKGVSEADIQSIHSIDAKDIEKIKLEYEKYGVNSFTREGMIKWRYKELRKEMPLFFELLDMFQIFRGDYSSNTYPFGTQAVFSKIPEQYSIEIATTYKGQQSESDILNYLIEQRNLSIDPQEIPLSLFEGNEDILFKLIFIRYQDEGLSDIPPKREIEQHLAKGFSMDSFNEIAGKRTPKRVHPIEALQRMGGAVVLKYIKQILIDQSPALPNPFGYTISEQSVLDMERVCESMSSSYFKIKSSVKAKTRCMLFEYMKYIFNHALVVRKDDFGKTRISMRISGGHSEDFEGIDITIQKLKKYKPKEMAEFMKYYPNMDIKDAALSAIADEVQETRAFIDGIYVEYIERNTD